MMVDSVPVQVADQNRHGIQTGLLTGVFAPVSGHNLIAAFLAGPHNSRNNHAILFDALDCLPHFLIVPYLKRVVREWIKVRQWQADHHFFLGWLLGRRGSFLSSPGR